MYKREDLACPGVWVEGLTPLSSYCASRRAHRFGEHAPDILELQALRVRENIPPVPSDIQLYLSRMQITGASKLRQTPDSTMPGIGPLDKPVSWPVASGDVVWAATAGDTDDLRRFGVYIGDGKIVYLGLARRAVSYREGVPYWKPVAVEGERVSVVQTATFSNGLRCGAYTQPCRACGTWWVVELAIACIGIPIPMLAAPGAQHFAVYAVTGVWLAEDEENRCRKSAAPVYFRGVYSRSEDTLYKTPGFAASSVSVAAAKQAAEGDIPAEDPHTFVHMQGGAFESVYASISLAEDLLAQKKRAQPYHDPLTGAFLAEDQVATIISIASELRIARSGLVVDEERI